MLTVISIVFGIIFLLVFSGFPLAYILFKDNYKKFGLDTVSVLAISLIFGYGISAFSVAVAYGMTGINSYFYIFIGIALLLWFITIIKFKFKFIELIEFKIKDLTLIIPILISIYLSSTQWTGFFKPVLKVGEGPDVTQNIMAAQSANKIGVTWFDAITSIKNALGATSFHQAALDLFRIPNSADMASYDYLVFGTRWGLTVPFNQFIRAFGAQTALLEVGVVLLLSLVSFSIIFFAIGKLVSKNYLLPIALSIIIISNSTLMFQFLNGGLSQILGSVSISGLLLLIIILLKNKNSELDWKSYLGLVILGCSAWLSSFITYIDSTLVILLNLVLFVILLAFINSKLSKKIAIILLSSGILSLLLAPIATYANLINLKLRSAAASGTGSDIKVWNFPSVHFGLSFNYSPQEPSIYIKIFSAVLFLLISFFIIFVYLSKQNEQRDFAAIGIAGLVSIIIGLYFSLNSNGKTNYIYDKMIIYLTPFILVSLLILIHELKSVKVKQSKGHGLYYIILISFLSLSLVTGINFRQNYFNANNTTSVPYEIGGVLNDSNLQKLMSDTNYLLPYKPTYNFASVLGAKFWISKAPNDFILNSRMGNDLRLLCFIGDVSCNPTATQVANSPLEKYGMVEFLSPISTSDFAGLNIDEKFDFNFTVFGMPVMDVPEKFKGGNPYYK